MKHFSTRNWFNKNAIRIVLVVLISVAAAAVLFISSNDPHDSKDCASSDAKKFDCYPEDGVDKESCERRGCCWIPMDNSVPSCFYPRGYGGYRALNSTVNDNGVTAYLEREFPSPYPNDVKIVKMVFEGQTASRYRIKIYDPLRSRFESPYPIINEALVNAPKKRDYIVSVSEDRTGFVVMRNDRVIFDSKSVEGLIFADQFLQISIPFEGEIYGLGEHESTLALDQNWTTRTLWNRDMIPMENINLYGSHPFFLVVQPNGTPFGVFLKNSNAMDVILQPMPAITFRAIGGIFDFYFLMGPTPKDVIAQYTELIGRPSMPPYWALGFHLCRLGYKSPDHIRNVLQRNLDAGIPVDTQWVDFDYMKNGNDFTLNEDEFGDLPKLVDELHGKGMHFVPILDPGVSAGEKRGSYPPYDEGERLGVLVKDQNGSIFIGKVWNKNSTAFPDFLHEKALQYWTALIRSLHDLFQFDGLWIDMNEPSNFIDGSVHGCEKNELNNPPFVPGGEKLYKKTICPSAVHAKGSHYNVHNLYGISESHITRDALSDIRSLRPFVITRSTFPGIGRYAGHWSGDVASTWHDMKRTVSQMLTFSLLGVPLMGSDICGFNGNTSKNLCMRWSQLGAFYPFSRNHNTDDAMDQDPAALGQEVIDAARNALSVRYSLLPYLYTLFWFAHTRGETVARPLFFEFPEDPQTRKCDTSFLWGSSILIIPVLEDQVTTVTSYVPAGRWYNWYSFLGLESEGNNITHHAPSDTIPIMIRGGAIIPMQEPAVNTFISRKNKMSLLAAYSSNLTGQGHLYWDDGDSLNIEKAYGFVHYTLTADNLTSFVKQWTTLEVPTLSNISILGFVRQVRTVRVNNAPTQFAWNATNLVMTLENLGLPMNLPFSVDWN